jgi:type I restriction enzyme, S subunit
MEVVLNKYKPNYTKQLPNDWELAQLKDVSFMKGRIGWQGLKQTEFTNITDEPFLITGMNFKDGEIRWNEVYHVSEKRFEIAKEIQLKKGDVLMTKDGTIGKILYVDNIPYPFKATLNSHLLVFRPIKNSYFPKYLYYQLLSTYFKDFIESNKYGTTFFGISQKLVGTYKIILPSLAEQTAIARVLSDTDNLIQSLEKLIEKKQAIKQGVMQSLLKPEKGWKTSKIGNIAKVIRGASPRPIDSPIWFDDQSSVGWVRISDVTLSIKYLKQTSQKLSLLGIKNSRFIKKGNLIMSICATVGSPILTEIDVCIHDGFVVFSDPEIDKEYLYYFLTSIENDWSKHGQTGSQMNLNTSLINSTQITYPKSSEDQLTISKTLSDIDAELFLLAEKLNKYKMLKQGIMQVVLTGKIRLI